MAVGIGRILARFFAGSPSATLQRAVLSGTVLDQQSVVNAIATPTWGANVAIDVAQGTFQRVVATSNVAYAIGAPTSGVTGQLLTIQIVNSSGGALGAATFNAIFKLGAAWTNPANNFSRAIQFIFNGTNWVEVGRTAADVAN